MTPHLGAQHVLVRMLFDQAYAAAVIAAPRDVLHELPHELADAFATIDPRALRRDVHRRERTIGELCRELPCGSTLAVHEQGTNALLAFFGTSHFHEAIMEGQPLVLALALHLMEDASPHRAALLMAEIAASRARRSHDVGVGLRRAPGVEPIEVPAGTLALLQAFAPLEHVPGHLPRWSVPPMLPALGAPTPLCAVCIDNEVSLVEIDHALHAVLVSLPMPRARKAVIGEAALRIGDRARAEAALDELIADELVLT